MPKFTMPIGKSDFAKVRTAGDYYIDKTMLIEQITASGAEVTLFTRPRRFGKSLNMSMLQHFFDIREKSEIFRTQLHSLSWYSQICSEVIFIYWMMKM